MNFRQIYAEVKTEEQYFSMVTSGCTSPGPVYINCTINNNYYVFEKTSKKEKAGGLAFVRTAGVFVMEHWDKILKVIRRLITLFLLV